MNKQFKKKVYRYLMLSMGFSVGLSVGISSLNDRVYAQEQTVNMSINGDISEMSKDRVKIKLPKEYMKEMQYGYLMEVIQEDEQWVPVGVERKMKGIKQFSPYIFVPDEQGEVIISKVFWEQLQEIPKLALRFVATPLTLLSDFQPVQVSHYLTLVNYDIMNEVLEVSEKHMFQQIDWQLPKEVTAKTKVYEAVLEEKSESNIVSREVDDMFSDSGSKDDTQNSSDQKQEYKLVLDTASPVYQQFAAVPNEDALKRWVSNVRITDKNGAVVDTISPADYKVTLIDPKTVDTSILGTTEYDIKVETSYKNETYVQESTVLVKIVADDEDDDELKGKGEGNTPPPTTPTTPVTPTTPTSPTHPSSSSPTTNSSPASTTTTSSPTHTNPSASSNNLPQLNDQRSWSLITIGGIFIISGLVFIKKYMTKKSH